MNTQQESIQKELKEARFHNQGEASILRKRMEKVCVKTKCDSFFLLPKVVAYILVV